MWCETSTPDLDGGPASSRRRGRPSSPTRCWRTTARRHFNWRQHLDDAQPSPAFQKELAAMGYVFQFITLAGWPRSTVSAFELEPTAYAAWDDMAGYVAPSRKREFALGPPRAEPRCKPAARGRRRLLRRRRHHHLERRVVTRPDGLHRAGAVHPLRDHRRDRGGGARRAPSSSWQPPGGLRRGGGPPRHRHRARNAFWAGFSARCTTSRPATPSCWRVLPPPAEPPSTAGTGPGQAR